MEGEPNQKKRSAQTHTHKLNPGRKVKAVHKKHRLINYVRRQQTVSGPGEAKELSGARRSLQGSVFRFMYASGCSPKAGQDEKAVVMMNGIDEIANSITVFVVYSYCFLGRGQKGVADPLLLLLQCTFKRVKRIK